MHVSLWFQFYHSLDEQLMQYIYIYIIQMPVNNEEKKNLPVVPDA